MSTSLANIRALKALSGALIQQAPLAHPFSILFGHLAIVCTDAAEELERQEREASRRLA